jgi:SAM-dependent methyltransferase
MESRDLGSDWRVMQFGSEYLPAEYYDRILKKYATQDGLNEDLDLLENFLVARSTQGSILELGCGSGRATRIIIKANRYKDFTVTDLSEQMLRFVQEREGSKISNYQKSDHIEFLEKTVEEFDTVVSFWSLAHSVFPWYLKHSLKAFSLIETILLNFFAKNLKSDGAVFIIQTDGASEEQTLIKKSWFLGRRLAGDTGLENKYYQDFQSPSIRILDSVFKTLCDSKIFDEKLTTITRVPGNEIEYESKEEALEVFMNFHLEGEFNGSEYFDDVSNFLDKEFEKILATKGMLSIQTGFWIYEARKI